MKFYYFLFLFSFCSFSLMSQKQSFSLKLNGIEVDSVKVVFDCRISYKPDIKDTIDLYRDTNNKWIANIPDSIWQRFTYLNIKVLESGKIGFHQVSMDIDSTKFKFYPITNVYGFKRSKNTFIEGDYKRQDKYMNLRFNYLNPDIEHYLSILISNIAFDRKTDIKVLKDSIKSVIKNNRESIALIKGLYMISGNIDIYGAPYLDTIFNLFSTEVKESFYGELVSTRIQNRLNILNKIPIINLRRADTGNIEPIIEDNGKYKLIIFSASWCAPCHRIIPIYKEIYKNIGHKLDMLYISMDETKIVNNWNDLIKKNEIAWKSYLTNDYKGKVMDIYSIMMIPFSYLIHPNLRAELIDVRNEEMKQRLYQLVNKM